MNNHLNLYKPYYQADTQLDPIENNLTRALVIAMQNNALLFYKIIELICEQARPLSVGNLTKTLFSEFRDPNEMTLEVQTNMRNMEEESFEGGVIAVSLTTQRVDMEHFSTLLFGSEKDSNRITDIIITVKSALFIIEVKRNGTDCRQQLYDQVHYLREKGNAVRGASVTWTDILSILYTINSIQKVAYEKNVFTEDLINLLEGHMPGSIPASPFSSVAFTFNRETPDWERMKQRLLQCVNGIEEVSQYKIRPYSDRLPVLVDWPWAREVSFWFEEEELGTKSPCLNAFIWPANTKGQGAYVYHKPLDWVKKRSLQAGEYTFELEILYEVKFCHFNGFVSSFKYSDVDLAPGMQLHTLENYKETGKYQRYGAGEYTWPKLTEWLDDYFVETFDWRKQCDWEGNFEESGRNNLTISFGFEVRCIIPYEKLQLIDKTGADYAKVSMLFKDIVDSYAGLLDS
jgi:hypothetical protein